MELYGDNISVDKIDKAHILWTKYATEGPRELQLCLENDDTHPYKKMYLNGVLNEVIKIGTAMIRWATFEDNLSEKDRSEYPGRHVLLAVIDEQTLWERKLLEILVEVILFSNTNNESFYKHYEILRKYDDALKTSRDFNEFFGVRNEDNDTVMKAYKQNIIDHETVYRDHSQYVWFTNCKDKLNQRWPIVTSFSARLKSALKVCTNFERVVLGFTYNKYSNASKSIHFTIDQLHLVHAQTLHDNLMNIAFAVMTVLVRIQAIIEKIPEPINLHVKKYLEKDHIFKEHPVGYLFNDHCKVGDYVSTTHGEIGQIVKIHRSQYGYLSYTVRALNQRTPETNFYTLPGFDFRKLVSADSLVRLIGNSSILNSEMINQGTFDTAVLKLWNDGLMNVMAGKVSFKEFIASKMGDGQNTM